MSASNNNDQQNRTILVTGGAGFIGSALIRYLLNFPENMVVNVDAMTYAASPRTLLPFAGNPRYIFEKADICDRKAMGDIIMRHRPGAIIHLAAESHVDRSIDNPFAFVTTNVMGTCTLLQEALSYWRSLDSDMAAGFRFLHVSTDEVYGSLGETGSFSEQSGYMPNSPYAASKASSDHFVRAWHHTHGLPVLISNCSNNYGPYQFPEKLVPLMIIRALQGQSLPVYGKGLNIRDWLHVDDHADALWGILTGGRIGESYNIGGENEYTNIDIVKTICAILDKLVPDPQGRKYERLISYVSDRPGHDFRYAIDSAKLQRELEWRPRKTFSDGLEETVMWYLDNRQWWQEILDDCYSGERLGLEKTAPDSPKTGNTKTR